MCRIWPEERKEGRRYVRTAEDVCDYILCGHQLNNTLSSWRYSWPPFFPLIFLHSSPCSPLLSDNTVAVFCQPERSSLIAIDTSRARQVMWLHTHRPVTVKPSLHVVLLRGRGQTWQCHLTHTRQADQSPGRRAHTGHSVPLLPPRGHNGHSHHTCQSDTLLHQH